MPDEKKVQMRTGTVAHGRSIDIPTGEKKVIGTTSTSLDPSDPTSPFQPITACICRTAGPGESVTLPADEFAGLVKRGFIIDPANPNPLVQNGSWLNTGRLHSE